MQLNRWAGAFMLMFAAALTAAVSAPVLAQEPASAKPEPYVVPGGKVYAKKGYGFVKTGSCYRGGEEDGRGERSDGEF